MPRPIEGTYQPYTITYISKVPEENLTDAFKNQQAVLNHFFYSIPLEKADYAYAPGKWTLKELLQHMIDTERVFAFRALCIARKEKQNLPGFEENEYAENSNAAHRTWNSLIEELKLVRQTTEILFNSFLEETLMEQGLANNHPVSVNALGFIAIGHVYHHIEVIKEKYL